MSYKMDVSGNWTHVGGSSSSSSSSSSSKSSSEPKKVDTTTSDTNSALKESSSNKTETLKYAEEASFTIEGDYLCRRSTKMNVRQGVAKRWATRPWLVIETTHTIDAKGYQVDGRLGRIPYKEEDKSNNKNNKNKKSNSKSSSDNSNKSSKNTNKSNNINKDTSGSKWKMDASGKWTKVAK